MSAPNTDSASRRRLRVAILGDGSREPIRAEVQRLAPQLQSHADVVLVDVENSADLSKLQADVAVVLGGDGSILRCARQMGYRQVPIVGVNFGKLGFLAELTPEELIEQFPRICGGECSTIEHLMLECRVVRGSSDVCCQLGLNEVTLMSGAPFAILDVDLYVDLQWVTTYSCDGLIVSTPVGSTAHNLSAGGPILRKDLDVVVLTPISAHTLTVRPVVDSASRTYEMRVPRPNAGTSLIVDGQLVCGLQADDRVVIQRAAPRFQLIEVPGHGYYRTLREKLGWGGRLPLVELQRQKPRGGC